MPRPPANLGDIFGQSLSGFGAGFPDVMAQQRQQQIEQQEREMESQQQRFSRASKMLSLAINVRNLALREKEGDRADARGRRAEAAGTREQFLMDEGLGKYDTQAGGTDELIARVLQSGDAGKVDELISRLSQIAVAKASGQRRGGGRMPPNEIREFHKDIDKREANRAKEERRYLADDANYGPYETETGPDGKPRPVRKLKQPFSEQSVDPEAIYKRDYAHYWEGAYGPRASDSLRAQLAVDIPGLRSPQYDTAQFTMGALAGGAPGGVPSFEDPQSFAMGRAKQVEAMAKKLPGWDKLTAKEKAELIRLLTEKLRTQNANNSF